MSRYFGTQLEALLLTPVAFPRRWETPAVYADQPKFRPPPFGISVHLADQLAVSHVGGELDMATAPQVTATLKPFHSRMTAVVFEVSEVSFIDVAGLRDLWFALSDSGTGVSFRNPSNVVRRLLGLIDRTDLIEVSDLPA